MYIDLLEFVNFVKTIFYKYKEHTFTVTALEVHKNKGDC